MRRVRGVRACVCVKARRHKRTISGGGKTKHLRTPSGASYDTYDSAVDNAVGEHTKPWLSAVVGVAVIRSCQ